jgi:tetratricopeptide (TPR) repeat protein
VQGMDKKKKPQVKKETAKQNVKTVNNKVYYLIIFVFSFILYGNTIPNDYSLDDNLVVFKNEQVMKGFKSIPEIFSSHYRESERNEYGYRPIAKVTFAIESEFFNQNPHVSHFINILLYALLLLLLFKLLNTVFPDFSNAVKLFIILLFASHPLHTEVVANLKNREEILCFLFATAAVLLFIKAMKGPGHRLIAAIFGVLSMALSILSKQTGLVFCVIIPLLFLQFYYKPISLKSILFSEDKTMFLKYPFYILISVLLGLICNFLSILPTFTAWLFFVTIPLILLFISRKYLKIIKQILPEDKSILLRYIYLAAFTAGIMILGYFLYKIPEMVLPSETKILNGFENPLFLDNSFYNRICLGFMGLLFYLKMIFLPFQLSFYYGYDMIPLTGITDFRVILSIVIHLFLFFIAIIYFYKNRIISFGIILYLIGLLMFANLYLPIPGIIGERLLFISSFGFCIVLVVGLLQLIRRWSHSDKSREKNYSTMIYIFFSLLILIFSIKTIARNTDWKDFITLYSTDIGHLEKSAKAHSLYADELMRLEYKKIDAKKKPDKTNIETALEHYLKAIEIFPEYPSVHNNIGTIYFMFYKDYKSALSYFKMAAEIDSLSAESIYNLAYGYELTGDTAKSLYYYEKAVNMDTANIELISRWADLLNKKGEIQKAIDVNMKITKINPASDRPYINIGNYYGALKDTANAVSYWEKAIAVAPENDKLNTFLAAYFKKKGNEEKYRLYLSKIKAKVK